MLTNARPLLARIVLATRVLSLMVRPTPDGWMMRFDRSGTPVDMANFRVMSPGWHVTTGRSGSAIFWQPSANLREDRW